MQTPVRMYVATDYGVQQNSYDDGTHNNSDNKDVNNNLNRLMMS